METDNSVQAGTTRARPIMRGLAWLLKSPVPLLIISVSINVVLAARVQVLSNAISTIKGESQLKVGAKVPSIEGTSLDGQTASIEFADSSVPTLLYFMRSGCTWCQRNNANLKAVIANGPGHYRVFVLSAQPDGMKEYMTEHSMSTSVVTNLSAQTQKAFYFAGTPNTVLVSPSSVVLKSWIGAYTGTLKGDVEKTLAVSLPGLLELSPKTSGTK